MKKFMATFLSAVTCLSCALCGCGGGDGSSSSGSSPSSDSGSTGDEKVIVSEIKTNDYGYTYLSVDGAPFPYYAVESRLDAYMNCEKKTVEEFEDYFEAAVGMGASVVLIPIDWRDLEPVKDVYDFTVVATLLGFANKYNVKVDFLWYSVNMCGDSNSYFIPDYIWNDEVTYPKYDSSNKNAFWAYYGKQGYLKASDALMQRETLMIENLMEYIYNWDKINGEKHPLIGIQVHNEPDGYPRWRVGQQNISENGQKITTEQAWSDVKKLLSNAGRAFKAAKYNVVTRVNLTTLSTVELFVEDVYNLEGIDCVGNDIYNQSVGAVYNSMKDFKYYLPNNFNHIAENKGSYGNTASLMLAAAFAGAGYVIYDLSTPQFFIDNTGSSDKSAIDHGILNVDLSDKAHTEQTRRTMKALNGAGIVTSLASKEDFAVFNLEESYAETNYNRQVNTTGITANFSTNSGAIGFAIVFGDYIYLFASSSAQITLSNGTFGDAEYGYFKDGYWALENKSVSVSGNTYTLDQGLLCRVEIESVASKLTSNTKYYIG